MLRGIEDGKPISMYLIDMHTHDRCDDGLGSWQDITVPEYVDRGAPEVFSASLCSIVPLALAPTNHSECNNSMYVPYLPI